MKYDLKVFANTESLDPKAVAQVYDLLKQEAFSTAKVRIMPDAHQWAGCVIGFTADLGDKVIPNVVGVDIGCGVFVAELGKIKINYQKLDNSIRQLIPSGFEVNTRLTIEEETTSKNIIDKLKIKDKLRDYNRLVNSIASLGGGNHFIEIDRDNEGNKYLIIHTGSRNLGKQVADYYQKLAIKTINQGAREQEVNKIINKLKQEGREKEISQALKVITLQTKISNDLAYLEGQNREDYLHDMRLCQEFAYYNRKYIAKRIKNAVYWEFISTFESIHNYIGNDNIVRKGAISAYKDEKVIIPINMQDGCIIGIGKGNEDWNYSAPHGAGRILSRAQARKQLDLNQFTEDMKFIYTTSVNEATLDESPRAYKPIEHILDFINDTVEIYKLIKPTYNFKAK